MKSGRSFTAPASKFLTLIVFLGITLLLMWEYRVTRASQQGMVVRIAHQNEETADLIIKAITQDMRGAQMRILANRDWDAPPPIGLALDLTEQVATTFARYPYPESFFTWRGGTHGMVFFGGRSLHRRRRAALPVVIDRRAAAIRGVRHASCRRPVSGHRQDHVRRSLARTS